MVFFEFFGVKVYPIQTMVSHFEGVIYLFVKFQGWEL